MRRAVLIGIVSLFAVSGALAQLPANPLEGTWEMVSQHVVYPDSTVDRTDQIPYTTKILNSTHFAFGRQILDEEVFAGGGTYSFDGDTYIEHITWHSSAGLAGQSITFDARVEGDTWYHVGHILDFRLEEVWKRIGLSEEGGEEAMEEEGDEDEME